MVKIHDHLLLLAVRKITQFNRLIPAAGDGCIAVWEIKATAPTASA